MGVILDFGAWLVGALMLNTAINAAFADPTMKAEDSELEARSQRKQHTSREGAGGGDGEPAGGGCGCGN